MNLNDENPNDLETKTVKNEIKKIKKLVILKNFKNKYFKFSEIDQEFLNQNKINMKILLNSDFTKIYVKKNFENFSTLKREIRFLFVTKLNQKQQYIKINFYIIYD